MSRPQEPQPQAGRPASVPAAVKVISAVLVLEAAALLVLAGWFVYNLFTATAASLGGAVFTAVLLAAAGVWLLILGHFFFRGFRWTRAGALVFQLFAIVLAVPTLQGGIVLIGLLLLLPAAAVLLLLFTRPVLEHTSRISGEPKAF
ncbi:hypothetical protein MUG94_12590 [Arthrobacter gengyunqii]|uniref:Uncharacterized protein n=1 Tax=Arthrobacter gengyunqii TaxID=2886940 RepID=A0A9X1LYG2_9MICC|nr:hypothetical protein [Arthrobacter gengyunqii]MCC3267170.1 hypothetical protein [Arthrobacter gengyunqii]MCC3267954.1 hypothetical protein [Arthrobacter gengyunqii]UOY95376.1 hypothetical protein MUG94_12590 [Arthrobacter gengyunqii]